MFRWSSSIHSQKSLPSSVTSISVNSSNLPVTEDSVFSSLHAAHSQLDWEISDSLQVDAFSLWGTRIVGVGERLVVVPDVGHDGTVDLSGEGAWH